MSSNVAKFLGISDEEYKIRHGDPLERSLELFRITFRQTIMEKIASHPDALSPEIRTLIEKRLAYADDAQSQNDDSK